MKNISVAVCAAAVALSAWRIQAQDAPQTPESICLSRLQQSAQALAMYTRDNDERFPPADKWNDALAPLLAKPSADASQALPFDCPSLGPNRWGYSMNWKLSKRPISEVEAPHTTVSLYETNVPRANAAYDGRDLIARHTRLSATRPSATRSGAGQSERGSNFAFADGHVQWLSATQKPNFRIFLDNKPNTPRPKN